MLLTAWLGFGAVGFAVGAMGVSRVRRRLRLVPVVQVPRSVVLPAVPVEQVELVNAA